MALNNSDPSNREAEMAAGSAWTTSPEQQGMQGSMRGGANEAGRDDASAANSADTATPPREAHGPDGNPLPASSEGPGSGFGSGNSGPTSVPSGNGESNSGNGGMEGGSGSGPGTTPVASGGDNPPATGGDGTSGGGGSILDTLPGVGSIIGGTGTAGGVTDTAGGIVAGVSDLVNDVTSLPGAILNGDIGGAVSQIVSDVTDIAGSALGAVTGALNGNDALAPVTGLIGDVAGGLQNLPVLNLNGGDTAGASILDLGGSPGGNAVDVSAGPSSDNGVGVGILADPDTGNTAGIHALNVGSDGPQILDASLLTGDTGGIGLPDLNGTGLLDITGATGNPLLTVNGGNTGDGTGLTLGDLNGSQSGHLINANAGPAGDNGTAIDVLSAPNAASHTADISVVDVGSGGPQLLDAGLLNDAGIPALNGSGLTGDLLDTGNLLDTAGLLNTGNLLNTGDGNLVTLNGGNNAGNGGVLGGDLVNLGGSSSGHLVDADAGPDGTNNSIDVLAAPTGTDNTANVNAVDVGSDGPQLADLGVATDSGLIDVPSLNGAGTDGLAGLTGNLLSTVTDQGLAATPATQVADLGDGLDLLPGSITGDHGILDVNGQHVI